MKKDEIASRLQQNYPDGAINVVDLTGTADHWQVNIVSKAFAGLSRIQCHRHVMDLFQKELQSGEIHAFTITTQIPK